MSGVQSLPPAATIGLACALGAWIFLLLFRALLPKSLLAAQMREQPPGTDPIRQLGGLVVIPLYLAGLAWAAMQFPDYRNLLAVLGVTVGLLWLVGIADDHDHLPIGLRLVAHLAAAAAVVFAIDPGQMLLGGLLPYWLERCCLALALVYFINMTNFMDGMDLMTVAGLGVPLLLCLMLVAGDPLDDPLGVATLVLAAALIGFGVLNWPPARLYLGDNGSLPLGLAAGVFTAHLAYRVGPVVAILPFGYYLADSFSTLVIRFRNGENILQSHSSHAYQRARQAGRSPWWVIAHVLVLNLLLAIAARMAADANSLATTTALAIAGVIACFAVIIRFRRQQPA